jgi:hypothetical protein
MMIDGDFRGAGVGDIRIQVENGDRLAFDHAGRRLAEYVFAPTEPQLESPRPYFSPLRTLAGREVAGYRPSDHVWHKGLSVALPVVDDENFWGGPSYLRGRGYVQLPNNGSQLHRSFTKPPGACSAASDSVLESLDWVTEAGDTVLTEQRRLSAAVVDDTAWILLVEIALRNVAPHTISFGSPTTRGREDAGYGGLFWRGPQSFGGATGVVHAPSGSAAGPDGDAFRGRREQWMAFSGRHDGDVEAWSTVVMVDDVGNPGHPSEWFVRSQEYACLCPAPFFSSEHRLQAADTLTLRYAVVIADGQADAACAHALAAAGQVALADSARALSTPAGTTPEDTTLVEEPHDAN